MLRQVVLVSYGTRFLRGELAFDEWYRHDVFRQTRFQFRAVSENLLLADDFTLWLGRLKETGAFRLSLHLAAEFPTELVSVEYEGGNAIVAHFANDYQIWIIGKEEAAWRRDSGFPSGQAQNFLAFPDATSYGSDLDSYWCGEKKTGRLPVIETNWAALSAAIAADLDIRIPSSHAPSGPFFAFLSDSASSGKLPLFPSTKGTLLAHQLMTTLYWEQTQFANDANPKNEGSFYKNLDDEGAAQADDWGRRLDRWMADVLIRCANECQMSGSALPQTFAPALARTALRRQAGKGAKPGRSSAARQAVETRSALNDKWMEHIALAIAIGVLSLFVLALGHIIARFPWFAVLIGLPWALWNKHKKKQ